VYPPPFQRTDGDPVSSEKTRFPQEQRLCFVGICIGSGRPMLIFDCADKKLTGNRSPP
jgi:hypothetical protein